MTEQMTQTEAAARAAQAGAESTAQAPAPASRKVHGTSAAKFFQRAVRSPGMLGGSVILISLFLVCVLAPLFNGYGPLDIDSTNRLAEPSAAHPFGTDNFGRDLLARVSSGGAVSLFIGLSVAALSALFGTITGLYAITSRLADSVLMRISDGLMAFPAVLLAIAIMAALGPQTMNVVIALTIVYTPLVARVVRSSALVVKEQTYIDALRSQGASTMRLLWSNVFPNITSPLLVQATFVFAEAVIVEAALSFLGVGVPAPAPSWGNILFDGKVMIYDGWWMTVFPGLAIVLTVLAVNLLGDGLRDVLDQRQRFTRRTGLGFFPGSRKRNRRLS